MTQEEFIEVLKEEGYSYEIEGDKIIVTHRGHRGNVYLGALTSLPPGVEFKNGGGVDLESLKSLPPRVVFMNGGSVSLDSLKSLPPGVEFSNEGGVYLESLIGGWFFEWKGNIEGIDSKRLLNLMISKGMFI